MTKTELKEYLEAGGSFSVEVNHTPYLDVLTLAVAVKKGGGQLTLTKTDRLFHSEILNLCDTAPGQIIFPDKKLED